VSRRRLIAWSACLVAGPWCLAGLAHPPGSAPARQPATPPAQTPPPPADPYTYDPNGRRDPFVSLLRRGATLREPSGRKAEDLQDLLIDDIGVRGIVRSRDEFLALIVGPDGRTFVVRRGDRLADGTVKAITADALLLLQDVSDPLSLAKQREVRKPLRPIEEAR
jgi:Tfp pilus assembly protein PilP